MRTFVKALAASALAVVLAASGSAISAEVKLAHDKGFWSEFLQSVGNASETATGVKIVETPYATAEQYKAYIQASIAGGELPEMFTWWTGQTFNEIVATGKTADLTGVWKGMVDSGQYDPGAADLFTVDGKVYAVPLLIARWVMLYDKKLFAELNIAEPKTWAELMAAAETLKAAGHIPFNSTVHEGWRGCVWFQQLVLAVDPKAYLGLGTGEVAYNGPEVHKAFEVWLDMYKKGYFSDPRSNREIEDFAAHNAGMYLMGEWVVGSLAANGLAASDIGAFITPPYDPAAKSTILIEGGPIMVSKAAFETNPDVTKALDFWTSVDGANAWAKASSNFMGNNKAQAPNEIISKISGDISAAGTVAYQRWWENTPPELQGELVAEMDRFLLDPTAATAEDVMNKMQALNQEYWDAH